MKYTFVFLLITLLIPVLFYCRSGDKNIPREININNSNTNAEICAIEDILKQVDTLLTGHIYETHCLDMHNRYVLSIWMVHPGLDPDASEKEVYANTEKAFGRGIKTAYYLLSQIPCIRDVFDCINPMIVDRNYSLWYRDIIPIRAFTIMAKYDDKERIKNFMGRHHEFSYLRTIPVPSRIKIDMSMWPGVRISLRNILESGKGRPNAAAYPILLDEYSSIQVYCPAWDDSRNGDDSVYAKIESIVELFAASSIPVEVIQVGFMGNDGMLKKYCNISGSVIRKYKMNDELDLQKRIRIHTMN